MVLTFGEVENVSECVKRLQELRNFSQKICRSLINLRDFEIFSMIDVGGESYFILRNHFHTYIVRLSVLSILIDLSHHVEESLDWTVSATAYCDVNMRVSSNICLQVDV